LVERASCASDRRVTYAVLTADGRARLREASESHIAGVHAFFEERFTSEELQQLASLLERLPEAAGASAADCSL
jgi:MarR family 2-MHQ and catechol resistance regulon transcriptional repressor